MYSCCNKQFIIDQYLITKIIVTNEHKGEANKKRVKNYYFTTKIRIKCYKIIKLKKCPLRFDSHCAVKYLIPIADVSILSTIK